MEKFYLFNVFLGIFLSIGVNLSAQVAINTDGSVPDNSAMLDVKNTAKGFLPPRMTSVQRSLIVNPSPGLIIFCTDCGLNGTLQIMLNNGWADLSFCSPPSPASPVAGIHTTSQSQITWKWYRVAGALDYRWNTVNDYESATDLGSDTSFTELGLTGGLTYTRYVWALNSCGISAATTLVKTLPIFLGQQYGGGVIFYLDGTGIHGLIAAPSDQASDAVWGCAGAILAGTSIEMGIGQANTTTIVNNCSQVGIAAKICNDLVLNDYSDWYLPSKTELNQMYLQKNVIGGFTAEFYWSSSQYSGNESWIQSFSNGNQRFTSKGLPYHVRAIRSF